jgi:hypothetical protein
MGDRIHLAPASPARLCLPGWACSRPHDSGAAPDNPIASGDGPGSDSGTQADDCARASPGVAGREVVGIERRTVVDDESRAGRRASL